MEQLRTQQMSDMKYMRMNGIPVESKFDEVAIYFTKEEWVYLDGLQKELYKNVMMENYQTLSSLGCVDVKPEIVSKLEHGEDPCVTDRVDTPMADRT